MTHFETHSEKPRYQEYQSDSLQLFKNQHHGEYNGDYSSHSQFSFSKQIKKTDVTTIKRKYHDLYIDLKQMEHQDLIQLLLEQIQENQEYKVKIQNHKNRIHSLEGQIMCMKQAVKKKSEAISLLCQTESKNLNLIEKLQIKLSNKSHYPKDTYYEKKYSELSLHMNQYIRSINEAHDQFKRAYTYLKNQNSRLQKQMERNQLEIVKSQKKSQIHYQQIKRLQAQIGQLFDKGRTAQNHLLLIKQQNQILRKQVQMYQQNIRITDRLQLHQNNQNQQLSSELDFIRDKILQNQHISKDIIDRLEQSSLNYDKIIKVKQQLNQSLAKQKKKIQQLQKQVTLLRKKNETLQQQITTVKKQNSLINIQKQNTENLYMEEKTQKQGIRRQLQCMSQKIRLMEETYRNQIGKNQKIKEELCKFWENKQRNDSHFGCPSVTTLSQIKLNQIDNTNSIQTFSYAETQGISSKLSVSHNQTTRKSSFKKPSVDESYDQQTKQSNKQNYNDKRILTPKIQYDHKNVY